MNRKQRTQYARELQDQLAAAFADKSPDAVLSEREMLKIMRPQLRALLKDFQTDTVLNELKTLHIIISPQKLRSLVAPKRKRTTKSTKNPESQSGGSETTSTP